MSTIEDEILYTKSGNHWIVGDESTSEHNALKNETKTCVILPTQISSFPVRIIGKCAFRRSTNLVSLHISRTIREIHFDAIAYISTLTDVTFDAKSELTSIGQGFMFTTSIKRIFIPPSVTSIGIYFLGITNVDDLAYCNRREANYEYLLYGYPRYWVPKRIHVFKNFRYSSFSNYTNIVRDGLCERMIITETNNACKSYYHVASFVFVVIFNS